MLTESLNATEKTGIPLKRQVCDLLNSPSLIQLLSNQQREPGKMSRPGRSR
jgi:hypothetical protein